jgi:hypothetical protein
MPAATPRPRLRRPAVLLPVLLPVLPAVLLAVLLPKGAR